MNDAMDKICVWIPLLFWVVRQTELSKRELGDVFYQLDAGAVDILLVVDNSCSMQPYQQELASNFDTFLTYFIEGDVDYQIGVATTTVTEPQAYGLVRKPMRLFHSPGHSSIIQWWHQTLLMRQVFSLIWSMWGLAGQVWNGIEAALQVLENPNAGLLREEAYLSVIFVMMKKMRHRCQSTITSTKCGQWKMRPRDRSTMHRP